MTERTGATLVARFDRMVRRDGGSVLLEQTETVLRVHHRPGGAGADCDDGSCVLPGTELRRLMAETLRQFEPCRELVLEVVP